MGFRTPKVVTSCLHSNTPLSSSSSTLASADQHINDQSPGEDLCCSVS